MDRAALVPTPPFNMKTLLALWCVLAGLAAGHALAADDGPRQQWSLSGPDWQFTGAGGNYTLPDIGSNAYTAAAWTPVVVPHVFQTRAQFTQTNQGWYRRTLILPTAAVGRHLYLMFEGAATVADVYVNGQHLGQHRGAYTRFVFDATAAFHPGKNTVAVRVDDNPKDYKDCLPNGNRLYTVWGGLYRNVWLVATDPLHIDPTDDASPGIYITPTNVTADLAGLGIKVLLRNMLSSAQDAVVRVTVRDPADKAVLALGGTVQVPAGGRQAVELAGNLVQPQLWAPSAPNLYHVVVEVGRDGRLVDEVTQPTGFRNLVFDPKTGRTILNGKPIVLAGADLHQEIEAKAAAMGAEDFRANFALMQDMGANFVRLAHYPRAQLEYDLCDQLGIFCWAENGHTNGQGQDLPGATADAITTEMVKQNYNHPSIAVWSVGNEAGADVAEREVPLVKALDQTRPVVVANMKCANADFHGINSYPGWYGGKAGDWWDFATTGYVTEAGAGGMTTIHSDYATAKPQVNKYEPEEYQQLVAEARFQTCIGDNNGTMGMFTWWCMRDFTDTKYKGPLGLNTKGLLTYAGDKKDIYYLYRCFLRPTEPTVHITSQRYFLRTGAADNGIKAYASSAQLTLTLNGETVSTLPNGQYVQSNGHSVDHVFYWKTPLRTGKNVVKVSDGLGHDDSAVLYYYGANGQPATDAGSPLVTDLKTSNPKTPAYFMDLPVAAQWPIYDDLDGTADNSFDTLPAPIEGARWIARHRPTKAGQESDLSFKLTRQATVYIMATSRDQVPAALAAAGFNEVVSPGLVWRDNSLNLVPAQLFSRLTGPGETIQLPTPDRDEIVLLKE